MYLIAGLGNPGTKYEKTRHNVGFMVLEMLAGGEIWEKKYDSEMIKTASIILAKPQTFMNLSGKAVLQIKKYFPEAQLVVVHDDLDLPLGSIKIMKSISSAGHNGVQNIIDELGSSDFIRIRIGTQNPKTRGLLAAEDYVLQKFTDEEFLVLSESLKKAKDAIECLLSEGLEITQSKYNG